MINKEKISARGWSALGGKNQESGFLQLLVIVIVALLVMRYFGLTISGILEYFNLTWADIISWFTKAIEWFKDLFNSVK